MGVKRDTAALRRLGAQVRKLRLERNLSQESLALQKQAVARQEQIAKLYRRVVVAGGVIILLVLLFLFYLGSSR